MPPSYPTTAVRLSSSKAGVSSLPVAVAIAMGNHAANVGPPLLEKRAVTSHAFDFPSTGKMTTALRAPCRIATELLYHAPRLTNVVASPCVGSIEPLASSSDSASFSDDRAIAAADMADALSPLSITAGNCLRTASGTHVGWSSSWYMSASSTASLIMYAVHVARMVGMMDSLKDDSVRRSASMRRLNANSRACLVFCSSSRASAGSRTPVSMSRQHFRELGATVRGNADFTSPNPNPNPFPRARVPGAAGRVPLVTAIEAYPAADTAVFVQTFPDGCDPTATPPGAAAAATAELITSFPTWSTASPALSFPYLTWGAYSEFGAKTGQGESVLCRYPSRRRRPALPNAVRRSSSRKGPPQSATRRAGPTTRMVVEPRKGFVTRKGHMWGRAGRKAGQSTASPQGEKIY